jgi:hypothetical protein
MRRNCFDAQKLLTTVRIQAGEPAILVRKVSARNSTQNLRDSRVVAYPREVGESPLIADTADLEAAAR